MSIRTGFLPIYDYGNDIVINDTTEFTLVLNLPMHQILFH